MAYQKVKAERYSNFGGLNTKVSKYQTDQQQTIRLINYDFSTPGALTKRPGFAYFGGASYGSFITQLYQYEQISGPSYTIVSGQSGFVAVGTSAFPMNPFIPPGTSFVAFAGTYSLFTASGAIGSTYIPSISTLNNKAFIAAYPQYVVFDGAATMFPPIPRVSRAPDVAGAASHAAAFFTTTLSYRWYCAGLLGASIYAGTPFTPPYSITDNASQKDAQAPTWYGIFGRGLTSVNLSFQVAAAGAIQDGCSYLLIYRQTLTSDQTRDGLDAPAITTPVWQVPVVAGLTTWNDFGSYSPGVSYYLGTTNAVLYKQHNYTSFWQSYYPTDFYPNFGGYTDLQRSSPTILEVYNSMMLFAGFTTAPSTVYWSNAGTPEFVRPNSRAEIRTNDGDVISNITAYGTECIIGKRRSFHSFTGTGPTDVSITLKSDQYGILSKRGACTWENFFWFLDRKGIVEYNGANFTVASTPVEDIFKRMNYAWAQEIAILSHQKTRNEIWCCIPVDGATYNNVVVVYDYVSKAWSTFEGVNASALIATALTLPFPYPVIGASGGRMAQMGQSNFADFGGRYTTIVRFPFVTNYGWSTDQVFRRLFVDTDPLIGNDRSFQINLYGNMLNTASYSVATTFGATYQFRIDYGLYGKSISVEIAEASTFPLKMNGYTVVSRFQRDV